MNAERGPGTGRRMLGIAPPVRGVQFAEVVVADICIHVQDAAERVAFEQPPHLLHRRLVAAFMTDAEYTAGLFAGCQNPLGAGCGERQRLLAEHLFAGGEGRDRHLLVQRVRRHDRDRVQLRIFQ